MTSIITLGDSQLCGGDSVTLANERFSHVLAELSGNYVRDLCTGGAMICQRPRFPRTISINQYRHFIENMEGRYVLVMRGANDVFLGVPNSRITRTVRSFCIHMQQLNRIPIIGSTLYIQDEPETMQELREEYEALATDLGLHFVNGLSLIDGTNRDLWDDRAHPNAAGLSQAATVFNNLMIEWGEW